MRSCWRTRRWPFFGHLAFEANWKGEKLDKWVPHELTKNQKHRHSEVSSFILLNNNEPFLYQIVLCNEKWIVYDNQWWPTQWLNQEEAPQHFLKPNLYQKMVILKCRLLLFFATNHFSIGLWCAMKSGFYVITTDDQLSGWTTEKVPMHFPKPN